MDPDPSRSRPDALVPPLAAARLPHPLPPAGRLAHVP